MVDVVFNHADIVRQLKTLPEKARLKLVEDLPEEVVIELLYDWDLWARKKQREPEGLWEVWLLLSGRGFGKTRTGAEQVKKWVTQARERNERIQVALIGETAADARDVLVEGESGILSISHPDFTPKYEPSKRRLTWPDGSIGILFAGNEPDQLRGPQFHKAWVDELAKYASPQETWDNLEFSLRLGDNPQTIVTTTPKPIPLIINLMKEPGTVVTRGSSYENKANLAERYIKRVIRKYEGTRLGQQEIHGQVLEDVQGALWTWKMLEGCRVKAPPAREDIIRVVVALDPSVKKVSEKQARSQRERAEGPDEVGIVVACLAYDYLSNKNLGFLLKDASGIFGPREWAEISLRLYHQYEADRIVGEVNNGGDLVEINLQTVETNFSYKSVTASRGKHIRAEPIASLYEQDLIKHVGNFPELEEQLTFFTREKYLGGTSPGRADALIWSMFELMLGPGGEYDPDVWTTVTK